MPGELVLRGSDQIAHRIDNAQPPAKVLRRTKNAVANVSGDLVVSAAKLEAGAVLGTMAITQLGTLTAVAEAVVEMHPAAAQGCGQILNAYAVGAANIIGRTVR
jgi:hypothetical protein